MNKLMSIVFLLSFLTGCERSSENQSPFLTARIVGFDRNCSTCILEFPENSFEVSKEIGQSPLNYYESINLNIGDYQIGQMLKVRIRKPDIDEFKACITLYPTYNYLGVFITDLEGVDNMIFNKPVTLSYHDCLHDPLKQAYICFDSLLTDSRCPVGLWCFWEGNAEVRLRYQAYNDKPVFFDLSTHVGFINDTIIDRYKFTLLDVIPYPVENHETRPEDYKVKLLIEKQ